MSSNFKDVKDFTEKFGVPCLSTPGFLDKEAQDFRVKFILEELEEFKEAYETNDLALAFDSLIDLVYVTLGTATMMGFEEADWQEMWKDVQRANMSKVRCTNPEDSERKSSLDVIKPHDFVPPQSEEILKRIIDRK